MLKKHALFLSAGIALLFAMSSVTGAPAQPAATSATGTWSIRYSGAAIMPQKVVLHQEGQTVVGTYGDGFQLRGNINNENPLQVDATWDGPREHGWATLIFSPDWKTFSGRYGLPARQPTGTFVAERTYIQINTTGFWDVTLTGQATHRARLKFTQNGSGFVGTWPNGHLTGSLPPGTIEVNGTWQTKKNSGPIRLTFTSDGKSFSGVWGYPGRVKGRVFGKRVQ